MSPSHRNNTPEENLERIAQTLERIEKYLAPPPLWQRGVTFFFQHFTLIVGMMALVFFIWQIWGYVAVIIHQIDSIRAGFSVLTEGIGKHMPQIPEGIKNFSLW